MCKLNLVIINHYEYQYNNFNYDKIMLLLLKEEQKEDELLFNAQYKKTEKVYELF